MLKMTFKYKINSQCINEIKSKSIHLLIVTEQHSFIIKAELFCTIQQQLSGAWSFSLIMQSSRDDGTWQVYINLMRNLCSAAEIPSPLDCHLMPLWGQFLLATLIIKVSKTIQPLLLSRRLFLVKNPAFAELPLRSSPTVVPMLISQHKIPLGDYLQPQAHRSLSLKMPYILQNNPRDYWTH